MLLAIAGWALCGAVFANSPAGLDSRFPIGAYLDGNVPNSSATAMPALLSETGAFTNVLSMAPHAGLVPYDVNSPLWSDNAIKARWIALPYDGTSSSPVINFASTDSWLFPVGTVFVKHFDLITDEREGAANPIRRLETRILVRNADGSYRGATYQWRSDNSDADLVAATTNEVITITAADGSTRNQTWLYPGPTDCLRCHTANAGRVLGIKTAQLNGNFVYHQPESAPDRTDNQLHTWFHLGMFDNGIADSATGDYPALSRMVAVDDTTATIESRVRSYLDANCAHCHRPGGEGTKFDARFDTPLAQQNIIAPGTNGFNGLIRNNAAASRLYFRDASLSSPMPPLARNVIDTRILDAYVEWANLAFGVASLTETEPTQLRVEFTQAVDAITAADITNYVLRDMVGNVVNVYAATPQENPAIVTLTTPALVPGFTYYLTINRVTQQQAPFNAVWLNSSVSFEKQLSLDGIYKGMLIRENTALY
jgi:mono/diheme cytochrome c family protein